MRSDLVLTGHSGAAFEALASVTLPRVMQYAARHGLDLWRTNLDGERPASWQKILRIMSALDAGFDRVLWIDTDVVISDLGQNIFDEHNGHAWQALVVHDTACGSVPNCGVWLVTRCMRQYLIDAWEREEYADHPWWEQAAVLELMGYHVTRDPVATLRQPTELHARTQVLAPEWNHHPHDRNRVAEPRFWHVTPYADRIETARAMVRRAEETR